ncbi:hypothetical protein LS684_05800 [Cytobacillus spongiae]|jgi:hypothetical protein|uniref:hypothetical protein n=1 Tax=Cytobacillus spongiae TaxID=2901381 RepID=UPI001F308B89|nr:hypothetical protein [Cytobacillus spongiae]UII56952.1 hypothetical protein LS684_05800 [Cytobacillus spongiae]
MPGVWVLVILIAVMILFMFIVQAMARQNGHTLLTQKDVIEALKDRRDESVEESNEEIK